MQEEAMEKQNKLYKMLKTTFMATLLSLSLVFFAKEAVKSGQLETAFILTITSSIITILLLLGLSIFFRQAQKEDTDE